MFLLYLFYKTKGYEKINFDFGYGDGTKCFWTRWPI